MKFKKNLICSAGLMLFCVNANGANFDTREILKETENIKKQVEHGALNSTLRKETWSVKVYKIVCTTILTEQKSP